MDMFAGRPMLEWVTELSAAASIVVAIGDCACWGGIPAAAPNPSDSTGLQFHKRERGGFPGPPLAQQVRASRHQHSRMPGAPRIGSPRSSSHWPPAGPATSPSTTCTGRRRSSRHSRKPGVPGAVLRVQAVDPDLRRGHPHRLPVLRVRLPRSDDALPVQPDPWNCQSSKTRAGMPCLELY